MEDTLTLADESTPIQQSLETLLADEVAELVQDHHAKITGSYTEMATMDIPTILQTGGNNGMDGLGGGGILGGLLLGSLMGGRGNGFLGSNGGFNGGFNGGDVGGVVTPALLASSLAQVTDTAQNTTVLQTLGDIKASVPLAEGQVQLALAGAVGEIRTHLGQVENSLGAGQIAINKNISEAIAASLASQNSININVLQTATQNLMATKDAQYAVSATIVTDGDKTRALIIAQNDAELNRIITTQAAELSDLRNGALRQNDRHGIEINMINNQNQNQLQFQAQAQVLQTLSGGLVDALQSIRATNQAINIGGTQVANPSNTNTNVKA